MRLFKDRQSAGQMLARELGRCRWPEGVVLALPRGGVPVAHEIAKFLDLPLDVLLVKKLAAPEQPEFAIGAVAEDDPPLWKPGNLSYFSLSRTEQERIVTHARHKIETQRRMWCAGRPRRSLRGKPVILVDDGLATGMTMRAAVIHARREGAEPIILAVPVAAKGAKQEFVELVDRVFVLETPEPFCSVGQWYEDFSQVPDEEVSAILQMARQGSDSENELKIPVQGIELDGILTIPEGVQGIVAFAHGSGSSRHSPRNQYVARALNQEGWATLLFDLLTVKEAQERRNVFDISLLAGRLAGAGQWLRLQPQLKGLPMHFFGASTGAAAALVAASQVKGIASVISRGGRPDLAGAALQKVTCPTLLLVGDRDQEVVQFNGLAMKQLARCRMVLVPGATHLFEEPGALDRVVQEARKWLTMQKAATEERKSELGL